MRRLAAILLWSAISAAFIGPGTVTAAAAAGCGYGCDLLWALLFSTIACLALQEASARLTIATGKPLALALGDRFAGSRRWRWIPALVVFSVVLGCAAYEAGNILGAAAGLNLGTEWSSRIAALICGLLAALPLFAGSARRVARILGAAVALMGVAFFYCAFRSSPPLASLLKGTLVPAIPEGAGMLALGLVGTTVVPYNLFLGSGLARGQKLAEARLGLCVAVPLGGLISMGILVAGTSVQGTFSFESLSAALQLKLGEWSRWLFAFGLFAAGLSSAVTAPLAAALCLEGFFSSGKDGEAVESPRRYRAVWMATLGFGLAFGLLQVKPIPAILLAQALNGVILPLVAVFLWTTLNDRALLGRANLNGPLANAIQGLSIVAAILLGCSGLLRAFFAAVGLQSPRENLLLAASGAVAVALAPILLLRIRRLRREDFSLQRGRYE